MYFPHYIEIAEVAAIEITTAEVDLSMNLVLVVQAQYPMENSRFSS